MYFLNEAVELQEKMVMWRRLIHQNAELGTELPMTSGVVKRVLDELNISWKTYTKYGVVGVLGKSTNRKILLRADMDALPMKEESGLSYASLTGATHSCGHDIHTAMLLGAATILKKHEDELKGMIIFMFQPDEEGMTGAKGMIGAGLLMDYKPDYAVAMHVNVGEVPANHIWIKQDTIMASSDAFRVIVKGKGGHGAHPETAINPINAATKIIESYNQLCSTEFPALKSAVLSVCSISSGHTYNVISDSCIFKGTLRALDENMRRNILKRMDEIAITISKAFRCECEFYIENSTPTTKNDEEFSAWVGKCLKRNLGEDIVKMPKILSMGSEDFAYISQLVPSCYLSLGVARESDNMCALHNPGITFNENSMSTGAAAYATIAFDYVNDSYALNDE